MEEFLRHCDEIFAFSDDSADLLNRAYPEIYKIRVIPHEPHYLPPISKKYKTTPTLNIGLLGVLCYKKGLDVVKEMVREIERKNLNIRIHLIGVSDEEIDSPVFSYTGRYTREMLPKLTLEEDIDIFFDTVNLAGNLFIYNLRNHVYEDAYSSLQHWCTGGESGAL